MSVEPASPLSKGDVRRYKRFLRDEVDEEALYRYLGRFEEDLNLKEVFLGLAESERRHQAVWRDRLEAAGMKVPRYRPSLRVRVLGYAARFFGSRAIVPFVTRMETAATATYDSIPEAVAHGLPGDERSHARLFREIGNSRYVSRSGVPIGKPEDRQPESTATALRAAVLGANDGLVSNLSLVMGVAGADPGRSVVLLTGLAGLLAGALSMALGEWISVRSAAEALQRQRETEAEEFGAFPEEEEEALTLIYRAKGLTSDEARTVARGVISQKDVVLEEVGNESPGEVESVVGKAWVAASVSFLTFGFGAVLPVVPWFFVEGTTATVLTVVMAGMGLFQVGAATSLFTRRGVMFAGGRMLLLGLAAAAITYGIGSLIGVEIAG